MLEYYAGMIICFGVGGYVVARLARSLAAEVFLTWKSKGAYAGLRALIGTLIFLRLCALWIWSSDVILEKLGFPKGTSIVHHVWHFCATILIGIIELGVLVVVLIASQWLLTSSGNKVIYVYDRINSTFTDEQLDRANQYMLEHEADFKSLRAEEWHRIKIAKAREYRSTDRDISSGKR